MDLAEEQRAQPPATILDDNETTGSRRASRRGDAKSSIAGAQLSFSWRVNENRYVTEA